MMPSRRFELAARYTQPVSGQLKHYFSRKLKTRFEVALRHNDDFFGRVDALLRPAAAESDTACSSEENGFHLSLSIALSLIATNASGKAAGVTAHLQSTALSVVPTQSTEIEVQSRNKLAMAMGTAIIARNSVWPIAEVGNNQHHNKSVCEWPQLEWHPPLLLTHVPSAGGNDTDQSVQLQLDFVPLELLTFVEWDEFAGVGALIPMSTSSQLRT